MDLDIKKEKSNSLYNWCKQNNRDDLLSEFDTHKNDKSPLDIAYGSDKKIFWRCALGHEWMSSPNNRTSQKTGCPICGNKIVLEGFNDLSTTHPDIAKEWHPHKNGNKKPSQFVEYSNESIWWFCRAGHTYRAQISSRVGQKTGCPFCSNKKVLPGFNDLSTSNPLLAEEWNYEKNSGLLPSQVLAGTHKKVWWKCKSGHEWEATVSSRSNGGHGCPYCANQKVLPGYNDLATTYPDIAKDWDYASNKNMTPDLVIAGSNRSYFWICSEGHSYKAPISQRLRGRGCPYCTGRKVLIGYNDLPTTEPKLSKEWHPTRNLPLLPTDVTHGSDKLVWWKCNQGHEWQAIISSRARGNGCPTCAKGSQTSLPEKVLAFYLTQAFPDTQCNVTFPWSGKMEADIYIPSLSVAIEYDGYKWHQNSEKDKRKDLLFANHGILLIRIREIGCPEYYSETSVHIAVNQIHGNISLLDGAIKTIFKILTDRKQISTKAAPSVDSNRDYSEILNFYFTNDDPHPYPVRYPNLLNEWNFEKNGDLNPYSFSFGSQKKVWWKCNLGHEWQAVIASRVKGAQCPYCTGRYVLSGFNDLETLHPELLAEWDYEKNNDILPSQILHSSNKKVWWRCKKGHSWQTMISLRLKNNNCPFCSNQKVLTGYNDLATTHPELLNEWDYENNTDITPQSVCSGTERKVWWICDQGHSYQSMISSRAKLGTGCPICYHERRRKNFLK